MVTNTKTLEISNIVNKLTNIITLFSLGFIVYSLFGHDIASAADATTVISSEDELFATTSGGSLRTFALTLINFILGFLGLLAVGFLIYGGFLVLTAGGEDGLEKGKTVMKNAVIGILIIVVSFAVINTIIAGFSTGTES